MNGLLKTIKAVTDGEIARCADNDTGKTYKLACDNVFNLLESQMIKWPTEAMCDAARWFILARDGGIHTWGKLPAYRQTTIPYIENKIKTDPEGHITKWDYAECVWLLMASAL